MTDDERDDSDSGDEEFELMSSKERNRRRIEERRRERRRERLDNYDSSANTFEQDVPHDTPESERLTGRDSGDRRLAPLVDALDAFADNHPVLFVVAISAAIAAGLYLLAL